MRISLLFVLFLLVTSTCEIRAASPSGAYCDVLDDPARLPPGNGYMLGARSLGTEWLATPNADLATSKAGEIASLLELDAVLRSQGTKLVYVIIPPRFAVYGDIVSNEVGIATGFQPKSELKARQALQAALEAKGLIAPDVTAPLVSASTMEQVFFKRDHHWTPVGARIAAQAIAKAIISDGFVPMEKHTFETSAFEGTFISLGRVVNELCGSHYPPETEPAFSTREIRKDVGLLDETSPPEVVLVGTSFSKIGAEDLYDFGGALSTALGTPVLNLGISGADGLTSLRKYVRTSFFKDHPPKYLIWETGPFGLRTPTQDDIQQLVGSMNGACYQHQFDLGSARDVYVSFDDKQVSHYLQFVADRGVSSISVYVQPDGLPGHAVVLEQPDRGENDGVFYWQVEGQQAGALIGLRGDAGTAEQAVKVSICRSKLTTAAEVSSETLPAPTGRSEDTSSSATGELIIYAQGQDYDGPPIINVSVPGQPDTTFEVTAKLGEPPQALRIALTSHLLRGEAIRISFENDIFEGPGKDRNLILTGVKLSGRDISLGDLRLSGEVAEREPDGSIWFSTSGTVEVLVP